MAPASYQHSITILLFFLASTSYVAMASDPSQLQDFCVGDINSPIIINGLVCKNPKDVTPDDFFFDGLVKPGNTDNGVGSAVTPAFAQQFPGLNTLAISAARIDFAPYGLNPPHTHPRGTELIFVLEGELLVGFVTSNPDNKLFTKIIKVGEIFIFPEGLIHFQFNVGKYGAVAFASLSSQNPGVITIANATFGANPPIDPQILAKAFQLDIGIVKMLEAKFAKSG